MKRKLLCSVILGSKVKLTPQGKIYTVKTCRGFGEPITLQDEKGKEIEKPYNLSVYTMESK